MKNPLRNSQSIICLVALLVFGMCLTFDFLLYDDHAHILFNEEMLKGHISYFWLHPYFQLYVPVVYTIWGLAFKIAGMNAALFHLISVAFHTANSLLINDLLKKMKFSTAAALAGALLFLVHPIQVESVAWISALKDVAFLFFSLLAIRFYLFSEGKPAQIAVGVISIVGSILAKPVAIVLAPFIIFTLWLKKTDLRNFTKVLLKQHYLMIIPIVISIFVYLSTRQLQPADVHPGVMLNGIERLLIVFDSLGFYIQKILVPVGLYPDYTRIPRKVIESRIYLKTLAISLIFLISLFWFWAKKVRNARPEKQFVFYFAVVWGLAFFLPNSGIVSFAFQRVSTTADRYAYALLFSVAVAVAALYEKILTFEKRAFYRVLFYLSIAVLGFSSLAQSYNWKDNLSLNTNLYELNPDSFAANMTLGLAEQERGENFQAFKYFARARELNKLSIGPLAAIAAIYFDTRQFDNLDRFVAKYLNPDEISKLVERPAEDLYAIFSMVADSKNDRGQYTEALNALCYLKKNVRLPAEKLETITEKEKKLQTRLGSTAEGCH